MSDQTQVIPSPPLVRERLAQSLREARLLRRQLRLSVQAAVESQAQEQRRVQAARPEGAATS
jgi:hypothetical protein